MLNAEDKTFILVNRHITKSTLIKTTRLEIWFIIIKVGPWYHPGSLMRRSKLTGKGKIVEGGKSVLDPGALYLVGSSVVVKPWLFVHITFPVEEGHSFCGRRGGGDSPCCGLPGCSLYFDATSASSRFQVNLFPISLVQ